MMRHQKAKIASPLSSEQQSLLLPTTSIDRTLLMSRRRLLAAAAAAHEARRGANLLPEAVGARAATKVPAGLEHVDNLAEAELERALLGARVNGLLGEQALLVLQVNDALLDRLGDGELVDDNVHGLVQTVHTVDGLLLDKLVSQWLAKL